MAEIILCNCICIAILLIVLIGLFLQDGDYNLATKRCKYLVYAGLAFVVVNLITEMLDGNVELEKWTFISNLFSYYTIDVLTLAFVAYLGALLGDAEEKKYLNVIVVVTAVRIILVSVLGFTGKLFTIEDGYFVSGSKDIYAYLLSILIMAETLIITIVKRKNFTQREFVVIMAYQILPVLALIAEYVANVYTITIAASTLSILMVYIFVQHETIEQGKVRADLLEEMSSTDLLTGLKNRRAYYKHVESIDKGLNVGVVFCDINGLKYINDHYGHDAGDEHIKKFAQMMTRCFRNNEVFRLSGDEFVAVMGGIPKDSFEQRIANFKDVIDKNNKIAAFGYAFGNACCIEKLYAEAEAEMYVDKRKNAMSRSTRFDNYSNTMHE